MFQLTLFVKIRELGGDGRAAFYSVCEKKPTKTSNFTLTSKTILSKTKPTTKNTSKICFQMENNDLIILVLMEKCICHKHN